MSDYDDDYDYDELDWGLFKFGQTPGKPTRMTAAVSVFKKCHGNTYCDAFEDKDYKVWECVRCKLTYVGGNLTGFDCECGCPLIRIKKCDYCRKVCQPQAADTRESAKYHTGILRG
jgi:methionyl-tRNA synthetase